MLTWYLREYRYIYTIVYTLVKIQEAKEFYVLWVTYSNTYYFSLVSGNIRDLVGLDISILKL